MCEYYDQCGFVKWLESGVNLNSRRFNHGDDCGQSPETCTRLNPSIDKINLEDFGPQTYEESNFALPPIYPDEDSGRMKRLP